VEELKRFSGAKKDSRNMERYPSREDTKFPYLNGVMVFLGRQ
jgi:hypothetical protein